MRRGMCLLLTTVTLGVLAPAQKNGEEAELRTAMQALCTALTRADADYVDKHYLPEVTRFHTNGRLDVGWNEAKANGFRNRAAQGKRFVLDRCDIVDARVYGVSGITAGHMYGRVTNSDDSAIQGPWRFTYLWVKTDGDWKEAHHHVSLLDAKE